MAAVEIHLRIRVPPGGEPALREFLAEAVPFYESPGGIRVRLLRRIDDPLSFVEVVEYATPADYEADRRRVESDPKMIAYLRRWRALLESPPAVETYERR